MNNDALPPGIGAVRIRGVRDGIVVEGYLLSGGDAVAAPSGGGQRPELGPPAAIDEHAGAPVTIVELREAARYWYADTEAERADARRKIVEARRGVLGL